MRWLVGGLSLLTVLLLAACSTNVGPAQDAPATPATPPTPDTPATPATPAPTVATQTSTPTLPAMPPDVHAPAQPPAPAADPDPSATPAAPDYATRTLTMRWSFAMSGDVNDSPRVDAQHVYLASEGVGVVALAPEDGSEQWWYTPEGGVWGRSLALAADAGPDAASGTLLVGLPGQVLASIDTRTGAERWRTTLVGEVQRPPLVVSDTVYVGTAFVGPGLTSQPEEQAWLYAINATSGEVVWAFETGNYLVVTPALDGDTLYAGGSYYDPAQDIAEGGPMRVYALDAASGTIRWTYEGDAGLIKRLHASDGLVAYLAYRDMLYTLDAETGAEGWTYHTANWTPDFLVADGVVYFGVGNGFLHAVDATSGAQRWKTRLDVFRRPIEAPLLVDGMLSMLVAQQQIFVLDAASGTLRYALEHEVASREGLVIAHGQMYLTGTDGVLYAAAVP